MEHPFSFDPTYGYDEARLLTVPAPEGPVDFADFWRRTFAETMAVPLKIERRRIASARAGFDVFEIEFNSLADFRVGGWISVPSDERIEHGIVVGHGYGGRGEPAYEAGAVTIAPCARGFNRSGRKDFPGDAFRHVLHGIKSRETYSHRGCAAELWSAASALLELYPQVTGKLHYSGTSFGGGLGAMALPWDERFRKGCLVVPSFGNIPLRLAMPCVGSGEAVRSYHRRHPECLEVLSYFDAATAARFIQIPVFAALALFDPAVPPPGQFAVYNGLAGPKEIFVTKAGHFPYPEEQATLVEMETRLYSWWRS